MATDYGGQAAYGGAQPRHGSQPGQPEPGGGGGPQGPGGPPGYASPPARAGRAKAGIAVAVVLAIAGVAGLGVFIAGVLTQALPREFTAQQQRQILDWELGSRWRLLSAGTIFPASVRYPPPPTLGGGATLTLTANRIGIARQASCAAASDAVVARVLTRNGCQAMLRATYTDATDSYVVTVGVAVFGESAQASAAERELAGAALTGAGRAGKAAPGVLTVPFSGTPAAWFTNSRRQLSASTSAGTYVVFYTVGYTGQRPWLPVSADGYADSEMTSVGVGVAQAVVSVLDPPLAPPRCPGAPGC